MDLQVAVEAAFRELKRQLPQADAIHPDYTLVIPYDGFDLRRVIEAALTAGCG